MKNLSYYALGISVVAIVLFLINEKSDGTDAVSQKNNTTDSLSIYKNMYKEASFFSIDENKLAQEYYKEKGYKMVMNKILSDLSNLNTQKGGNPLLSEISNMPNTKIYKATVLNHRWIIAAYKNNIETGEILIQYTYSEDKPTTFTIISSLEY